MKAKAPRLVLVEWLDSTQPIPSWRHLDDAPALEAVECVSVGWLVGENKTVKMRAPNIGAIDSDGNAQGSGFIRIPVRCITRQVDLVEAGGWATLTKAARG